MQVSLPCAAAKGRSAHFGFLRHCNRDCWYYSQGAPKDRLLSSQ